MTPDLQSTLDAIDDLAVHRCGQCDVELGPDAPSSHFCSPEHQEAFYAARSEALVGYREPNDLPQHVWNQREASSPETTPRGTFGGASLTFFEELHFWSPETATRYRELLNGAQLGLHTSTPPVSPTDDAPGMGPEHPLQWWLDRWPSGICQSCGGQCDGGECGLHAAGCVFGGPNGGAYWLIAEGCDLWHGETLAPLSFMGFRPGDAELRYSNAGARCTPPRRRIDSRGSR